MANLPERSSIAGLALIIFYEGIENTSYQDSVGVWTIGVGHTSSAGPPEVTAGMTITNAEAVLIFNQDVQIFEGAVKRQVTVDLTQDHFDALVSWTFNLGETNLSSSTMLKVLNAGDYWTTIHELLKWDNAGGEQLRGLTRRRGSEAGFFIRGNIAGAIFTNFGVLPGELPGIDVETGQPVPGRGTNGNGRANGNGNGNGNITARPKDQLSQLKELCGV